jgi:hypothetical protein
MVDDKRMIAIAIGVAGSVPPKYLAGAIHGAHAFENWASRQGYETLLVTDEAGKVTMILLRKKIEDLLKASNKPIHRIIVYFAGHGLIRELEEGLWLLSDWRVELRAVAVEVLKRRLSMYGPRQVCIISDACRSLPSDIQQADLVADPILGAGPRQADMTVAIDKFIAAQDGTEAFVIPGEDPEQDRCLFSGVLIEGLWGLPGLQQEPFSKHEPDKVTSRSLGAYLQAEVASRAKDYGLTLTPTIIPTFPEDDDYYFTKDPAVTPPKFPPWPPKGKFPGMGPKVATDGTLADQGPDVRGLKPETDLGVGKDIAAEDGFDKWALPQSPRILDQFREQGIPGPETGVRSGVAILGAAASRLWLGKGPVVGRISPMRSWSIKDEDSDTVRSPAPALIEFPDGRFAATVVLPDLFTSLVRDQYGVIGIVYRDLDAPPHSAMPTEQALAALEGGALQADAVTDLGVQLREWKHVDPVLGVISAYLYDAIGDIDAIRRMASFYAQYNEAIPYDIALLGGLRGVRTERGFVVEVPEVKERRPRSDAEWKRSWTYSRMEARSGLVGGLWPWMRQGWVFLDDPGDVGSLLFLPGLVELRSALMRSRFTTFEKDAALALARLCDLQSRDDG